MDDIRLTITAVIDLLGFSQHLELGNSDIRTNIGGQAVERLNNLERAIELFENERKNNKEMYPSDLFCIRINDSIILNIDIDNDFLPSIGNSDIEPKNCYLDSKDDSISDKKEIDTKTKKSMNKKTLDVCLFVGLLARIHNYINELENENNLPGCRTVVATGLRKIYHSTKRKKEDRLSANFSFSNAYIVSEAGSQKGFDGNNIFIDENIARIISYNKYGRRILFYSSFLKQYDFPNPFNNINISYDFIRAMTFIDYKIINIDLFRKKYVFNQLDSFVLSNLQLIPIYSLRKNELISNSNLIYQKIYENLENNTITRESFKENGDDIFEFPLAFTKYALTENINEILDRKK
jgi:hypothetical protein